MNFEFSPNPLEKISADVLIVFALLDDSKKKPTFIPMSGFMALDGVLKGQLTEVCHFEQFTGKSKESVSFYPNKSILASKIVIIGLGNASEFVADDLRRAMGRLAKRLHYRVDSVALVLPDSESIAIDTTLAAAITAEAFVLGTYEFGKYKEQQTKDHVLSTIILSGVAKTEQQTIKTAVKTGKLHAQATKLARDLVNEQSYIATPTFLATLAKDIAKSSPQISCKVLDRDQIEKLGMHAFLGIARAADTPPKFIVLTYAPTGKKSKEKLAIVGKGITFDSGGVNLKFGDHMQDMKMDMAGAAAVLGIFSVIAELKPRQTVMGIIAATPNVVSANSIVPGDVVQAMNGKTIEIMNTDAEGRVTMADSLSYAVKEGATEIIDLATLTGACIIALGDDIAGMFPNNQDLATKLKSAAFDAGEKIWEMPMDRDYREQNKSEVADLANVAKNRYGGAITAGLFLNEFVGDTAFAHLDIAGPAFTNKGTDISPKGGTGFGVRTMLHYLAKEETV